jgi:hypothetical protein
MIVSPPSRRRGETSSAEATGGLASPLSVLSTFRRDSLSACPLKLDHDGHVLVDLWLTHFPKMTQLNLSPDIEAIYRPTCNLFFLLAMSSPASFQTTVLHFAALHRANLREVTDDRHVIYHRTKSLHMLQRAIRHSSTTDDDLVAVLPSQPQNAVLEIKLLPPSICKAYDSLFAVAVGVGKFRIIKNWNCFSAGTTLILL